MHTRAQALKRVHGKGPEVEHNPGLVSGSSGSVVSGEGTQLSQATANMSGRLLLPARARQSGTTPTGTSERGRTSVRESGPEDKRVQWVNKEIPTPSLRKGRAP